jgi:lipoprotein-releasing system permease protein
MFRPLEACIGLRYTRARRRNHFISFIALFSILGIALGVLVMITVLSVMNGFQTEVRERILGAASHVTINATEGTGLSDWQIVLDTSAKNPHVIGSAPFVRTEGMLTHGQYVSAAFVRGIDPALEPQVSELHRDLIVGDFAELTPGSFKIYLGKYLARTLGVYIGDKVTMVTPQAAVTPAGILPRLKRFTVAGIFETGHNQYDSGLAVVHIRDAARLMRLGDNVSGVRIKLDDIFAAPFIGKELVANLPGTYRVSDWTKVHANFFRAVQIEKRMMSIILTCILLIAAFNIVSMMVMTVTEKQSDIAILRTLGASPGRIMRIFIIQGTIIGMFGALLGIVGGVSIALNIETIVPAIESLLGTKFLSPDVYLISDLPSELQWLDVGVISVTAFVITLLATLYPAWRAARVQPAEALRYE